MAFDDGAVSSPENAVTHVAFSRDAEAAAAPKLPTTKDIETQVSKLPIDVFIRPAGPAAGGLTGSSKATHEELIPGLKGWLGTLVSRRKSEAPEPAFIPESASIADRIARDFGLLGATETT